METTPRRILTEDQHLNNKWYHVTNISGKCSAHSQNRGGRIRWTQENESFWCIGFSGQVNIWYQGGDGDGDGYIGRTETAEV